MICYCDESQLLSEGSAATTGVGCCWEDCYKLLHLFLESKNNCLWSTHYRCVCYCGLLRAAAGVKSSSYNNINVLLQSRAAGQLLLIGVSSSNSCRGLTCPREMLSLLAQKKFWSLLDRFLHNVDVATTCAIKDVAASRAFFLLLAAPFVFFGRFSKDTAANSRVPFLLRNLLVLVLLFNYRIWYQLLNKTPIGFALKKHGS